MMLDQNNNIRGGDNFPPQALQFSDLTGAQMSFIRQIESFMLSNNLQLDAVLVAPPVNVSPMQTLLTTLQFETLGRLCRTEILDFEQMHDLQAKLRDPANPIADQLSIPVLNRLL